MCSVNCDCDDEILALPKISEKLEHKVCRSCDSVAQVVLRKKDVYCKTCFLDSSTHKFRAALGKSKMLKAGDKVLAVFTGNQSSVALLHFLHSGLQEEINKRLVFNVDLLYIDDGLVLGETLEKREEVVEEIKQNAKSFNFKLFIATLSEVFSEVPRGAECLCINENHEDQLQQLFKNVKTMTAKEDLLYQLKQKLIVNIAENMEYGKVLSSETGTELAVKFLAGISCGRGEQMSAELGFCDNRNSKVPTLRPLKDFIQKEIIFYNVFNSLKPIRTVTLTTMSPSDVSIQKTTEKFINELQEEFPSTVYTIFRTGDKLKLAEDNVNEPNKLCCLCNRIMKIGGENFDVKEALDFSRKVSEPSGTEILNRWENDNNDCDVCSCSKSLNKDEIGKYFCYGCSLIFRDMDNKDDFQNCMIQATVKQSNLKKLKDQISDFLIE